ncbi:MAG TPA: hypothetical protein VE110_00195 [Gemmatimonadaceae bacterium]|nr:hypothetical protein [Gemmatimonadaceae bacterium]
MIQGKPATAAANATPAVPHGLDAPVLAQGARTAPSASAVYEGLQAQRQELKNQLSDLQNTRDGVTNQLEELGPASAERKPLEDRLTDIDSRISSVDKMLAGNATQLAQAAAIPGAVVPPPPEVRRADPDEMMAFGFFFTAIVLFPITFAYARRIWRRSAATVTAFPKELMERLQRMEEAVESTAVEVERIGEGQRFLTRLFTEGESARAIGAGAAQPIQQRNVKATERLP